MKYTSLRPSVPGILKQKLLQHITKRKLRTVKRNFRLFLFLLFAALALPLAAGYLGWQVRQRRNTL